MNKQYVETINDAYRLVGTRISLDSVVHAFWRGQTAESIAQSFPLLTLEQVYGALTYYLAHKSEIDVYLEKSDAEFEILRQAIREKAPVFYKKLADLSRPVA